MNSYTVYVVYSGPFASITLLFYSLFLTDFKGVAGVSLVTFSHVKLVIGSHVDFSAVFSLIGRVELRQYLLWKGRFLLLTRLPLSRVRVLVWSATEAVMPCWKRRRRSTTAS